MALVGRACEEDWPWAGDQAIGQMRCLGSCICSILLQE